MAMQYANPPEMQIDPNKSYTAHFKTSKGEFDIKLFAKEAPVTVNNFVFLAGEGYYNGITFQSLGGARRWSTWLPTKLRLGASNDGFVAACV